MDFLNMAILWSRGPHGTHTQGVPNIVSQDPSMGLVWNHILAMWWLNITTLPNLMLKIVIHEQKRHFPWVKRGKKKGQEKTNLWPLVHWNSSFQCAKIQVLHTDRILRQFFNHRYHLLWMIVYDWKWNLSLKSVVRCNRTFLFR